MKLIKNYNLYYFNQLGTQRCPSVYNLLLEQKDNLYYRLRKRRESSRRNVNIIYFSDIKRYAAICATLINNSDPSNGVVILDNDDLVYRLNLKHPVNIINLKLYDSYSKEEHMSPFESNMLGLGPTLKEINEIRSFIKSTSPSHSYLKPMTEDRYKKPIIFEYVELRYHEEKE